MSVRILASLFACVMALGACGDDDDPPGGGGGGGGDGGGGGGGGGDTYFYVISSTGLGELDEGTTPPTAPGFNLDGSSDNACTDNAPVDYQNDLEPSGVDNQLLSLAEVIKEETVGSDGFPNGFDLGALLSESVLEGDLLLLFELSGVDSLEDDDSVTFKAYLGRFGGATLASSGGKLSGGQTFNVRDLTGDGKADALVTATAKIEGGHLTVSVASLPVSVPALDVVLELEIESAKAEFDVSATALTNGMLGGSIDVAGAAAEIAKFEDKLPIGPTAITQILSNKADLGANCDAVSAALVFTGADAEKGSVVE